MALFFKKTKEEEGFKNKKKKEQKEQKIEVKAPADTKILAEKPVGKTKKRDVKIAPAILNKPQITEKATFLMEKNQYIFQVFKDATKPEVKKAVEEVYGVDVEKVRIINVGRKKKRLGRTTGWTKGYKKAIVTLKKGQEIELIPR